MTNLVLLVAVAALGAWALLGEQALRSSDELDAVERKVFKLFQPDDVVAVEIEQQAGDRIVLSRLDDGAPRWRVTAPVEDIADEAEMRKLLNALERLEHEAHLAGEALEGYELGEVTAKLRLTRSEERPAYVLELGTPRPGKVVPIRVGVGGAAAEVFHVDEDFAALLTRDLWLFRSKQLFTFAPDEVREVVIEVAGDDQADPTETTLVLADGSWRLGSAQGDFAHRFLVDGLVKDLLFLRAVGIDQDGLALDDLARTGLAPPRVRLRLTATPLPGDSAPDPAPRVSVLELGHWVEGRAHERYARFDGRPQILYRTNVKLVTDTLARAPAEYLGEKLIPVEGDEQAVTGLGATLPDGSELRMKRREDQWVFEGKGEGIILAAHAPTQELIKELLALEVTERLGPEVDETRLGLDDPDLVIVLAEEGSRHEVHVGEPKLGEPGVHYVKRLAGPATDGRYFAYTVDLGVLSARLEAAPLELLDRTILKAHPMDANRLVLRGPDGAVEFEAKKINPNPDAAQPIPVWAVKTPFDPDADHDRVNAFMKRFEQLNVDRYVALLDDPDAVQRYGLTRPRRLEITVWTYKDGERTEETRVLLVGERTGEQVYVAPEGGQAIGLVGAAFLDRIARGFSQGAVLLEVGKWDVKRLVYREGDAVLLDVHKPKFNWKRGAAILEKEERDAFEDLLDLFERVEVKQPEEATPARLAETGLAPPVRRIELVTRVHGPEEGEETRVLLVGQPAGEREVWATAPGGKKLGRLFDEVVRKLDRYRETYPSN